MVSAAIHLDWGLVARRLFSPDSDFARALWTTVYISVVSQVGGIALGLVSSLAGMSRSRLIRAVSTLYVTVIRGTPLIVQIFFVYYAVGALFGATLFPREIHVGLFSVEGVIVAGIVALALNEGAYASGIIRAGIAGIDSGQLDAAKAVGMRPALALRRVVLPQAFRATTPELGDDFTRMLKNTSLLAFIGVAELFLDAEQGYSVSSKPVEYFAGVAFWYLVLTTAWTLVQIRIERRLGVSRQSWAERLLGLPT
jgi:polar amino acid transport system permease protein